jgi:hypothetical protein
VAKLGKQAVDTKRINPRTEEIPGRTEKKEVRFEKERDRKEKTIVLKEFWSQASRPFRLFGWHLGELRQECDANPGK